MIFSILLMAVSVSGDASQEVFIRRLMSKVATQDPKSPEALVRRLDGLTSSLPLACIAACPSIEDYEQSMMTKMMKYTDGDNMDTMDIGGMMQDIYGHLCNHKTALECVSNNIDACTVEGESSDTSIDSLASVVDCFCVACPGSGEASGAFMGEIMNLMLGSSMGESQDTMDAAMIDKLMTLSCMMMGAMQCWTENSDTCAAAMGANSSMSLTGMLSGGDGLSAETCEQMGKSTDYTKLAEMSSSGSDQTASAAPSPLVGAGLAAMLLSLRWSQASLKA